MAATNLSQLLPYHQVRILKEIKEQLSTAPLTKTKREKLIEGLRPPWANVEKPFYQLKIVPFRIFYEVHGSEVEIMLIRLKTPEKRTEDLLKEYSPMRKQSRKGRRTILVLRRGRLVPHEIDVRGKDEEQIALGLDDELFAAIHRYRRSRHRLFTLEEVCQALQLSF